ncbi:Uncharacterised protein [Mycobacteroides abscessus]|nr:Uncharacterised protein [Mycobacteroides abscessus]
MTTPRCVTFCGAAGSATTCPVSFTVLVTSPVETATRGSTSSAVGNAGSVAGSGAERNAITASRAAIAAQMTIRRAGKTIRRVIPTCGLLGRRWRDGERALLAGPTTARPEARAATRTMSSSLGRSSVAASSLTGHRPVRST